MIDTDQSYKKRQKHYLMIELPNQNNFTLIVHKITSYKNNM